MKKPLPLGVALLMTTFLTAPAWAQDTSAPAADAQAAEPAAPEEEVEISAPGASAAQGDEIVVTGRNIPNVIRATPEVVSVLSNADIARTGEGDIAGALTRVTGLSVVGEGFVYVRGLGDRYSLSLLNGSPLPSPEPLKRVVPLDIFPSRIVSSAVVQKSYSPNYPGEFGGGVVNLTTSATPREPFLSIGITGSGDTETTAKLGYTYSGGDLDWLGYDDGTRKVRGAIRSAGDQGIDITDPIAISNLSNADTTVVQRNNDIPANVSAELSGGTTFDVGDSRLGVIASAGYSNSWVVRDALQQGTTDAQGALQEQFQTVLTDNRVLVNGLLGLGLEIGEHKLRLTNLYIHDTVKQARLASGFDVVNQQVAGQPAPLIQQNTFFFERQLYDLQGVAELKFGDLSVDLRGTYANSRRESPYERGFSYVYDGRFGDYVNHLNNGDQTATIAFSDLNEDLYAGQADLSYRLPTAIPITLTGGYAYTDTDRTSTRYYFAYRGPNGGTVNDLVAQLRPDFLLSDYTIQTYGIILDNQSASQAAARYDAGLKIHAGYVMGEAELSDALRVSLGVRYEDADEFVTAGAFTRSLKNDYFLPAATVTWEPYDNMQLRLHGSKTIARPQFRELAPQIYQDFTSDREYVGNPFLVDSKLYNAEARFEWYFARDQRLSLAGFYKKIDNPIETVAFFDSGNQLLVGFANAPKADLYGGEVELQKYFPLDTLGGEFFSTRRLVVIANYTYSKSKLKVGDEQAVSPIVSLGAGEDGQPTFVPSLVPANGIFRDGSPLTGQSDHLVNLQIGIEDTDRLSQATLLLSYASERVTNRGPVAASGGIRQPDFVEKPGFRLDFVAREEIELLGAPIEIKFEVRNITGTKYQEYQSFANNRIDINSYDVGTTVSLGASLEF